MAICACIKLWGQWQVDPGSSLAGHSSKAVNFSCMIKQRRIEEDN